MRRRSRATVSEGQLSLFRATVEVACRHLRDGAEPGVCVRCGRTLTDPASVSIGIGAHCLRKAMTEGAAA